MIMMSNHLLQSLTRTLAFMLVVNGAHSMAQDAPIASSSPSTNTTPSPAGSANYTPPAAISTIVLPPMSLPEDKAFVHPGLLQSQADIDFIRQKLAAKEEPWTQAWNKMSTDYIGVLKYNPKPVANVFMGPYGKPDIGAAQLGRDGTAAYCQAIEWCLTGDKAHADKAIAIINAWSSTLQSIGGPVDSGKLVAGWTAAKLCNAAELLRYYKQPDGSTSGWTDADQENFKKMLLTVFYPMIENFKPEFNGNWDTAMVNSMLCIGVVCDDHDKFNRAIDYYLHGKGHGAITHYIYDTGQCQESTRDQGHVQMGLGGASAACEVAWKQGLDLFGAADNRLLLGYEFTAKYELGNDVPHTGIISEKGRGKFLSVYELVYQHYVNDKGMEMPFTKQVLDKIRPEYYNFLMSEGFGTLSCYRGPTIAPMAEK